MNTHRGGGNRRRAVYLFSGQLELLTEILEAREREIAGTVQLWNLFQLREIMQAVEDAGKPSDEVKRGSKPQLAVFDGGNKPA